MKKYAILLVGCLAFSSCYKLDTVPYDRVNATTFWKTEEHAFAGVMGCYNTLKKDYVFGLQFMYDNLTDVAMGYDAVGFSDVLAGTITDRSGNINDRWKWGFDLIQRCNHAIAQIQQMELEEEKKNLFVGEAKFLRALAYFQLYNLYGALPIYDETIDLNADYAELKNPRSSVEEVMTFIRGDLQFAIDNLPVSYDAAHTGRVTKGAAYALRGKVELYAKNWTAAIADFEEIVQNKLNSYNYSLAGDYASLFTMEGDNQPEMIFAIQNMGGTGFDYGMPMALYMGARSTFGSCWNNSMPSTRFADSYENKDGSPFNWDDHFPNYTQDNEVKKQAMVATHNNGVYTHLPDTTKLLDIYRNRDPRMMQTLIVPYSHYLGWNANKEREMTLVLTTGANENFGQIRNNRAWMTYLWRKFVPEGNMKGALTNRAHVPINFPLIRYADVLLMLAEAYNEDNRLAQAIAEVNKVRDRSSMPGLNSGSAHLAVADQEEMRLRISHERKVELAGEGWRYFDLKRWEQLEKTSQNFIEKSIVGDNLLTRQYQSRHKIWPIPGQEIEINPALKQNDEWK